MIKKEIPPVVERASPPPPKKNPLARQLWYVKLPGQHTVCMVSIESIEPDLVCLNEVSEETRLKLHPKSKRYIVDDVVFVRRIYQTTIKPG